jgi:hypothetical protein
MLLAHMKGQWDERGGRILLGENTGGGAVMRGPIRFKRVAARNLNAFPYIHVYTCV